MSAQKIVGSLQKVFVYGTLKRGEPNHCWLTKIENGYSRFICEAKTENKYPLVVGTRYNIPFLLDKVNTGHQIHGEVFEVDSNMFAKLDELEEYPGYYDRELQQVVCENGSMECWLYIIRNYPAELLNKQQLESYRNTPEQPYCERSQRDPNEEASKYLTYYLESNKNDMYEQPNPQEQVRP